LDAQIAALTAAGAQKVFAIASLDGGDVLLVTEPPKRAGRCVKAEGRLSVTVGRMGGHDYPGRTVDAEGVRRVGRIRAELDPVTLQRRPRQDCKASRSCLKKIWSFGTSVAFVHNFICAFPNLQRRNSHIWTGQTMPIVYLPTCPACGWTMRLLRMVEKGQARVRVFECARCHAELIWTPTDNKFLSPLLPYDE
jgi:hypothetical protein